MHMYVIQVKVLFHIRIFKERLLPNHTYLSLNFFCHCESVEMTPLSGPFR